MNGVPLTYWYTDTEPFGSVRTLLAMVLNSGAMFLLLLLLFSNLAQLFVIIYFVCLKFSIYFCHLICVESIQKSVTSVVFAVYWISTFASLPTTHHQHINRRSNCLRWFSSIALLNLQACHWKQCENRW